MRPLKDFQLQVKGGDTANELIPVTEKTLGAYKRERSKQERKWLKNVTFKGKEDEVADVTNAKGDIKHSLLAITITDGTEDPRDYVHALSGWVTALPAGTYSLPEDLTPQQAYNLSLGWGLGAYTFDKHKSEKSPRETRLVVPKGVDKARLQRDLAGTYMVQDLINEPSNFLGPDAMEKEARGLAEKFGASVNVIKGKDLLEQNYALIHAVGRAAVQEPRLVDILWGDPKHPLVTIVGKGVAFDTGGLNKKDDDGMRNMKNDMAGYAHAVALSAMIMDAKLSVRVRLMLPIVENADAPGAYKQGDVLKMRKGETMEVIHTDAEGRVILSDTLYEAAHPENPKNKPEMIIDFATLSWVGYESYPNWGTALSNNDSLKAEFMAATRECQEYFAERPMLWSLMKELKKSDTADIRQCNDDHASYDDLLAGVLLAYNVGRDVPWIHLDLQAWRDSLDPRTPFPPEAKSGGFAQGLRSAYRMIEKKFAPG